MKQTWGKTVQNTWLQDFFSVWEGGGSVFIFSKLCLGKSRLKKAPALLRNLFRLRGIEYTISVPCLKRSWYYNWSYPHNTQRSLERACNQSCLRNIRLSDVNTLCRMAIDFHRSYNACRWQATVQPLRQLRDIWKEGIVWVLCSITSCDLPSGNNWNEISSKRKQTAEYR